MIDGFGIYIPNGKIWGRPDVEHESLEKRGVHLKRQQDENSYYGTYANLRLRQKPSALFIDGNLGVFMYGNIAEAITAYDYKKALERLENDLKLDLHSSYLYKVDFGDMLVVDYPTPKYLECFGRYKNYCEDTYYLSSKQGCLTEKIYSTRTGGIAFRICDKTEDMKSEEQSPFIPEEYRNQNIIKLELRLRSKGLWAVFGKKTCPYDLLEDGAFKLLEDRYLDFYQNIQKESGVVSVRQMEHMTPNKVMDLMTAKFIQLHPEEYEADIALMQKQGLLTKDSLKRIRRKEKELFCSFIQKNELIKELEHKIERAHRFQGG